MHSQQKRIRGRAKQISSVQRKLQRISREYQRNGWNEIYNTFSWLAEKFLQLKQFTFTCTSNLYNNLYALTIHLVWIKLYHFSKSLKFNSIWACKGKGQRLGDISCLFKNILLGISFFVFTIFSFSFWQLAVLFLAVTSSSSSRLDGQTFQVWRYRISIINTTWFRKSFLCPNLLLYIILSKMSTSCRPLIIEQSFYE